MTQPYLIRRWFLYRPAQLWGLLVLCLALVGAGVADLLNRGHADEARPVLIGAGGVSVALLGQMAWRRRVVANQLAARVRELGEAEGGARTSPLRFVTVGDTGHRPQKASAAAASIARLHESDPLAAVWLLGDLVGRVPPYEKLRLERLALPFTPVTAAGVPLLGLLGNHDVQFSAELQEDPLLNMEGRRFYSRTYGEGLVTFFVLDSERLIEESEQVRWLVGAIGGCASRWRVLLLHHPLRASSAGHGASASRFRRIKRALEGSPGVHLVLTGHNHLYERRRWRRGVVHVTCGSGSAVTPHALPPDADRAALNATDRVHLVLEFDADRLSARARTTEGAVVDEFSLVFQGGQRPILHSPLNAVLPNV